MIVKDIIEKIQGIDERIELLLRAENNDNLPGYLFADDFIPLLKEYRDLLLNMKVEKK